MPADGRRVVRSRRFLLAGNETAPDGVRPDVGERAAVISLDDHRAWRDVRHLLASVRCSWVEPPAELLPAVLERLDGVDRHRRHGRWVACAGGLAAGAFVLASRRRAS